MPVDLYNLGVSGLLAAQQQLATTGHNIANVDTKGYTRQQVIQGTQGALWEGGNYHGIGVYTQEVRRIYDQFAFSEAVYHQSRFSYAETYHSRVSGLDETLSKVGNNLLDTVASFYDALNSVVDQPTDIGTRQVLLDKADAMCSVFNSLNASLEAQYEAVNTDISSIAQRMNEISSQLADMNRQIITASGNGTGATPNDLLDRRDKLISELSEYTTVSTVEQQGGAVSVIIGSGQTLVAGNTAFGVATIPDSADVRDVDIVLTQSGNIIPLSGSGLGGQVGALYDYREREMKEALNELGLTALAIADAFNHQQAQGLDLHEAFGNNLFTDINEAALAQQRAISSNSNTGNSQLQIDITEVSNLNGGEYKLLFDGTDYRLKDLETGKITVLGAPGAITMPDADGDGVSDLGFEITELSGTPLDGDTWTILPSRGFAGDLETTLTDPAQVAASSIFALYPSANNVSPADVKVIDVDVTDPNYATAKNGIDLTFLENPAGSGNIYYDMLDPSGTSVLGAPVLLPPTPAQISYGGITMLVRGKPLGQPSTSMPPGPGTPEHYNIQYAFGSGNNGNAVTMTEFQTSKFLKGDSLSIEGHYQSLVTRTGVHTETASIQLTTSNTTYSQAMTTLQSAGGVNLDEEASNLIRYQQSYQAAARIVTVAREITDTILNAF